MRVISNGIRSTDQIGPSISLSYKSKTKVQTVCGGLLMIAVVFIGILGFGYFLRDIIFKLNPITKTNKLIAVEKKMELQEYPISFSLARNDGSAVLEGDKLWESFELTIRYLESTTDNGSLRLKVGYLKTKPCTQDYFGRFGTLYENSFSEGSFCIDFSKLYNRDGTLSDIDASYKKFREKSDRSIFDVKLKLCDENKKPNCTEEFDKEAQVQFFMTIFDEQVNFDDYSSPISRRVSFYNASVSAGIYTRKLISINSNKLTTDEGIILSNQSTQGFISSKVIDTNVTSFNSIKRSLFAYTFEANLEEQLLERRYVRIQEIIANIGGFMKLIFFVASLFNKYFALYSFYSDFGAEINKMQREVVMENKTILKDNLVDSGADQSNAKITQQSVNKMPKINTEITFWAFLCSLITRKKENRDVKRVFDYLDLSSLARRIIEVEALKAKLN